MNARRYIFFAVFFLAALLAGAFVMTALAESDDALRGISFPIAELGNCGDRASCKAYCDDAANMSACIEFSAAHGLINQEEAERGKKFAAELKANAGPGGCTTPGECREYCGQVANVNACVEFAKKHKLNDKVTGEAERLAAYLESGGATPGNCDSAGSCRSYCGDLAHADECRTFAEKAGLATSEGRRAVPPGQFQKLAELAKNGRTPGGCTTGESCGAYCGDAAHRAECIAFGKEAGLIDAREADAFEQAGVTGPGGCTSKESCHAFCNEEANRDACFAFAKEHNLIPPEELKKTEEGLIRFRQGFAQAPEAVVACLKANVGENIIEDIQAGKLTPGPDIGERTKACFERFGKHVDTAEEVKRAPANVISCLKEKVGATFASIQTGKATMTPEIADAVRVCGEHAKFLMPIRAAHDGRAGSQPSTDMHAILRSTPERVQACVKEKLGDTTENLLTDDPETLRATLKGCYESFRPSLQSVREGANTGSTRTIAPSLPRTPLLPTTAVPQFRPAVLACLKDNLLPEAFQKLLSGVRSETVAATVSKCTAIGDAYKSSAVEPTASSLPETTTSAPPPSTIAPAPAPVEGSMSDIVIPTPPPPEPAPAL